MDIDSEDESVVAIDWQGDKNSSGMDQIPPCTIRYFYQASKDPGIACVAFPLGTYTYDLLLFREHPLYLPHWVKGYFEMVVVSSKHVLPYLGTANALEQREETDNCSQLQDAFIPETSQQTEPSPSTKLPDPKTSRNAKALKIESKLLKLPIISSE